MRIGIGIEKIVGRCQWWNCWIRWRRSPLFRSGVLEKTLLLLNGVRRRRRGLWLFVNSWIERRDWTTRRRRMVWFCSLVNTLLITKKDKYSVVTEVHKECTCAACALANSLQKANSGSNWRLSSEQVGGTECSFVCHIPGSTRGISPGYFLPQQGIVSLFFSGVGRQPISASPVLFLANVVWITWLQCCRLCEHEWSQVYEHLE